MAEEEQKQPEQAGGSDSEKAPIIIKKISGGGHGHHGGAWKVAYADFVTAMMAFFLLMWLLNATPSDKLRGIAQYFEPTVGIGGQKGIGFQGGKSRTKEGTSAHDNMQGVKYGVMRKGSIIATPQKGTEVSIEEMENEQFAMVEGELKKVIMSDQNLSQFQDSIMFDITPEGLEIKITDQDKYPMFEAGSSELSIYTKNILRKITGLIKYSPNFLSISGHTDSNLKTLDRSYSNWELSSDRANATRRFMTSEGIPGEQFARIVGKADTSPLDKNNTNSVKNRRVTITLLRNSIAPYNKIAAPKELLQSPEENNFDNDLRINE